MPLLGRYKSAQSASSSSATQPEAATAAAQQQATSEQQQSQLQRLDKQQVCESPLFGIRKQLTLTLASSSSSQRQELTSAQTTSELTSSIPKQISKQQIHYAFSIMDTNQDGMIDLRDLSQMLANLGVPIDEAILSHIMSSVSKRGKVYCFFLDCSLNNSSFFSICASFLRALFFLSYHFFYAIVTLHFSTFSFDYYEKKGAKNKWLFLCTISSEKEREKLDKLHFFAADYYYRVTHTHTSRLKIKS